MGKNVSVNVDRKSPHYSDKYFEELKSYLSESGLSLDDEITFGDTTYLDYEVTDIISWADLLDGIKEKFPNVTEEFEEGYDTNDLGEIGEYDEFSKLHA